MIKLFYQDTSNILNQTLTRGNLVACVSSLVSVLAIRALSNPRMQMTELLNEYPKKFTGLIFEMLNFSIVGIAIFKLFGGTAITGIIAGASSRPLLWIAAWISLHFNPVINEKKIKRDLEKNEINEIELASSLGRIGSSSSEELRCQLTLELFRPFIKHAEECANTHNKVQEAEKILQMLLKVYLLDTSKGPLRFIGKKEIDHIFEKQIFLKIKVGIATETLMQFIHEQFKFKEIDYIMYQFAFISKIILDTVEIEHDEEQLFSYKTSLHKIMDFSIANQCKFERSNDPDDVYNHGRMDEFFKCSETIENSFLSCLKIIEEERIKQKKLVPIEYALYDKLIQQIQFTKKYHYDHTFELHQLEKLSIIGNHLATWGKKITAIKYSSLDQHSFQQDEAIPNIDIPNEIMKKIYSFFPVRKLVKMREISKICCACIDQDPIFNTRFLSKLINHFTQSIIHVEVDFNNSRRRINFQKNELVDHSIRLGIVLIDISKLDREVLDQSLVQKCIKSADRIISPLKEVIEEKERPQALKDLLEDLDIAQS